MDAFLHAHRVTMILVVVPVQAEGLVSRPGVGADGAAIATGHFQAQIQGTFASRALFGPGDELGRQPPAPHARINRQGVKPRQARTTPQRDQNVSRQAARGSASAGSSAGSDDR